METAAFFLPSFCCSPPVACPCLCHFASFAGSADRATEEGGETSRGGKKHNSSPGVIVVIGDNSVVLNRGPEKVKIGTPKYTCVRQSRHHQHSSVEFHFLIGIKKKPNGTPNRRNDSSNYITNQPTNVHAGALQTYTHKYAIGEVKARRANYVLCSATLK